MAHDRFAERHSFNVPGFIQLLYDTKCLSTDFWVKPVWGLGWVCDVFFLKAEDPPCSPQNRILFHQCWPRPAGCSDPQDRKVGMGKRGGYTFSLRYTNFLWNLLFLSYLGSTSSFVRMIESSTIDRYSDQPELFKFIKSLSVDTLAPKLLSKKLTEVPSNFLLVYPFSLSCMAP